jgi:hypothetical protein
VSYGQEDRRYPYTKTERRKLPKLDRASAEYLRQSYGHAADTAD